MRKRQDNDKFPYLFEEIKPNGSIVPRYDFAITPTQLEAYGQAVEYLNSRDYAFYTLFLFTKITPDQQVIRFVNRRLIIQNIMGDTTHQEDLPEGMSPMQKIEALLGRPEGLLGTVHIEDFKNIELGQSICPPAPVPSLTAAMQ